MDHNTVPDPADETWHFVLSEKDPTCLKQVLGPEVADVCGILENTLVRPPATYCGYRYDIAPGPPPHVTRAPLPGYAAACGLARCWQELSDYWMGSLTKTADRLFDEYLDLRRYVVWGQPARALRRVSRDRVRELARLQRRLKTPPPGYDAQHGEIAPRVSASALQFYDALEAAVSARGT